MIITESRIQRIETDCCHERCTLSMQAETKATGKLAEDLCLYVEEAEDVRCEMAASEQETRYGLNDRC